MVDNIGSNPSITRECHVMVVKLSSGRPVSRGSSRGNLTAQDEQDQLAFLLSSCNNAKDLFKGQEIHARIRDSKHRHNTYLGNLLVQMYGKCGRLGDARKVFDEMKEPNSFSYNIMIAAYAQTRELEEMKCLFDAMPEKSLVAFNNVIAALARNGHLEEARRLFGMMRHRDAVTWNSLIAGYAQNGRLREAKSLFDGMSHPNVVSWTTMIQAYAQNGHLKGSKRMFDLMSERNVVSWNTMLQAYAQFGQLEDARNMFDKMPLRNVVSWTAIMPAFTQIRHLEDARRMFFLMPERNVVSWTSLIGTYAQNMDPEGAKSVFDKMPECNIVSLNALIVAYAQSGHIERTKEMFDSMPERNVVSWTTMIAAYAQSGCGKNAIDLFQNMNLEGINPDGITFMSVLNACSHVGQLDQSWCYFRQMNGDHGIEALKEHYITMIDILGRAGQLKNAEDLINKMPFLPDAVAWGALLAGCKIHRDVECAERAAKHVLELDPENAAPYVLLANIYAAAGRQRDVARVRKIMEDKSVVKLAGISFVEVQHKLHRFVAGDTTHPKNEEIREELQRMCKLMREAGYVPDTKEVLRDVSEGEKEKLLQFHSEKMAVAFGLISTEPGAPIRIMKNLRVCCDCHAAMKLISKISERQIIVRDTSRFHHFENGFCSCKDYW